ncbi:hypothetical protein D9756_010597 [Leucocoprinus leucothites]|uniref:Uncharacterized protein n=1 Tax=Leucocoprinus leucothites TaxID=201217 RepID=A0A8H5CRW3_9AGAR|nr:hypothetical protein D9756_010597 [Leucoagaricus leucothites]
MDARPAWKDKTVQRMDPDTRATLLYHACSTCRRLAVPVEDAKKTCRKYHTKNSERARRKREENIEPLDQALKHKPEKALGELEGEISPTIASTFPSSTSSNNSSITSALDQDITPLESSGEAEVSVVEPIIPCPERISKSIFRREPSGSAAERKRAIGQRDLDNPRNRGQLDEIPTTSMRGMKSGDDQAKRGCQIQRNPEPSTNDLGEEVEVEWT